MKTFYSHMDGDAGVDSVRDLFSGTYGLSEVRDPSKADIIIWNGGADIGTSLYDERPALVGVPEDPSARDLSEVELFRKFCDSQDKLLLGICRGSQFLNVMNGGKLYQHVDNHGRNHEMIDLNTKEVLKVTSTHHQMMRPNPTEGEVIGVSSESTLKLHEEGGKPIQERFQPHKFGHREGVDVEIMWYPKTHSLCIQGHPEYVPTSRFAQYTLELITQLCPKAA